MSKRSNIQEDERTYGCKRHIDLQGAVGKTHVNGQKKFPNKRAKQARAKDYLPN